MKQLILDTFFDDVTVITHFQQVSDPGIYTPVPDDWWIVAGDIRNSTEAIENGKYKEVNAVGASLIVAVSNVFSGITRLPFTFGGDGAAILIPNKKLEAVQRAVLFCRDAALQNFGFEFKAGLLPVNEIRKLGHTLGVAKLKLSETVEQALFWGEGLAAAELIIKNEEFPGIDLNLEPEGSMNGLECRWQEVHPDHDEILTCIINARGQSEKEKSDIYASCINRIQQVFGVFEECNPISEEKLVFTKNWRKLMVEWKIRTWKPTLKRRLYYAGKLMFQIAAGQHLMKKDVTTEKVAWGRYKSDLIQHDDFRKFEGGLRFVLSGTKQQRKELLLMLGDEYKKSRLFFGLSISMGLMITCFITNYHQDHIHFIDGSDGGYTKAARQLKQQMEQVIGK